MRKRTINKIKETACGLAFIAILIGAMLFGGYMDSTYSMDATIKTDTNGNYIVDVKGERWDDDRANEYKEGDEVKVIFGMNGTEHNRYDDIVIKIK